MSCLAWNCRSLGSPRAIHELKNLVKSVEPEILFLMETRLPEERILYLRSVLGFSNGLAADRRGLGGGLALLWHDFIDLRIIHYSTGHISAEVHKWHLGDRGFIIGFYGNPEVSLRTQSWELLRRTMEPWLILGDFMHLFITGTGILLVKILPKWC